MKFESAPIMTDIHVRRAQPADAERIANLLTQLGYPTATDDVPVRLSRMTDGGRAAVFVAERAETVLGVATAHIVSVINRPHDVAWLTALVVDESTRGSGVGRALVESVEAFGRQSGCGWLSVTTHERRADAHAFYQRIGFEHTGRRFGKALVPHA